LKKAPLEAALGDLVFAFAETSCSETPCSIAQAHCAEKALARKERGIHGAFRSVARQIQRAVIAVRKRLGIASTIFSTVAVLRRKALGLSLPIAQGRRVLPTQKGALRLFRFAGVQVYLHWSWFVVALVEFNLRREQYSSPFWNVAEYLALFVIVLLHEFGHALACRQTGGQADTIVLWPLGGVAYVAPPQRPGATLWSIAAGPLVNLILLPVAVGLALAADHLGWTDTRPNLRHFLWAMAFINGGLLVFNLLPVYPLDGGQILRALLWFAFGRARSLIVATVIGLAGALTLGGISIYLGSIWFGLIALFMFTNCWRSLQHARLLHTIENSSARDGFQCPACRAAPIVGPVWICHQCRTPFDTFATQGVCPKCQQQFPVTSCPQCGASHPMSEWLQPPPLGDGRVTTAQSRS